MIAMLRQGKASWNVSEELSADRLLQQETSIAWAVSAASGELRYILDLEGHERGQKCGCVCVSCREPLIAVNVAKQVFKQRPHFRHVAGAEKDSCAILAAKAALLHGMQQGDFITLPRRVMRGQVVGLSGETHDAWIETPPENVRVARVDFIDLTQASVLLDDGREIIVWLAGRYEHSQADDATKPVISVHVPQDLAGMPLAEIIARLKVLWGDAEWCNHWQDKQLSQQAQQAAIESAREVFDWADEANDLTDDERRSLYESHLHRAVKEIIAEAGCIRVPQALNMHGRLLEGEKNLSFVLVEQEKSLPGLRPDLFCTLLDGTSLLIEITVTHGIDEAKTNLISQLGMPALEIDLGKAGGRITREDLARFVVDGLVGKRWIFYPDAQRQSTTVTPMFADRKPNIEGFYRALLQVFESEPGIPWPKSDAPAHLKAQARDWEENLIQYGLLPREASLRRHLWPVMEKLMSIRENRSIGHGNGHYTTAWQVINTILCQQSTQSCQWQTLYLLAIKCYEPTMNAEQKMRVDSWRNDVIASIRRGETRYMRPTYFDELVELMFPEMQAGLRSSFGKSAHIATVPEYPTWLSGMALARWKNEHREAAKMFDEIRSGKQAV